ncbi:hypothetical protein [Bacillus phage SDFMU_Pbc]|uniref:Uncharacterized protein n=1 Tax=Bacillus phage SDFMU_Pbc TaxID=3076135 RepID=A0AA96KRS7_9CAUD|nr:hypothetical protein [Bacillus phage SDFMU_Pbc]
MNIIETKEMPKSAETVLQDTMTIELTRGELIDLLAARVTVSENELYGSVLQGMAGAEIANLLYKNKGVSAEVAADNLEELLNPNRENLK